MSNVLVYSGPGVSSSALSHTLKTLRTILPSYDVQCINAQVLALDLWMSSTSLLVLPGGKDLPFVDLLGAVQKSSSSSSTSSRADEKIREYVQKRGGSFLGICAGAYYASSFCEFEKGDAVMQVVGERPALQFFPGTCRGTVFPGFIYESDKGARMVDLEMVSEQDHWTTYYNGGGAFIDAEKYQDQGVEVLARYMSEEEAEASSNAVNAIKAGYAGQAAVVRCRVGKGKALLYGTHPEFPLSSKSKPTQRTAAPEAVPDKLLEQLDLYRLQRIGKHLQTLGLEVKLPFPDESSPSDAEASPKLTPILLTSRQSSMVESVLQNLQPVASSSTSTFPSLTPGPLLAISDSNDTIHFYNIDQALKLFEVCAQADYSNYTSPVVAPSSDEARAGEPDEVEVDLNKVLKYIIAVTKEDKVESHLTPHWDAVVFYSFAQESRRRITQVEQESWITGVTSGPNWGGSNDRVLLAQVSAYAQIVTSTQTMLDKNYKLLTRLPNGFTYFATHQMSGRGRGKNSWISPLGCLQFSTLLHFSPSVLIKSGTGGIVFVQYLAGLAIVESVRSGILGQEYTAIGEKIRIKWPNDVYAEVGQADDDDQEDRKGTFVHLGKRYAKMAGVLVNSQFTGTQMSLVVGCGINTLNPRPTTSLSDLIQAHNSSIAESKDKLSPVCQELFAGAILATFEQMWNTFINAGGSFEPFIQAYRRAWLHS